MPVERLPLGAIAHIEQPRGVGVAAADRHGRVVGAEGHAVERSPLVVGLEDAQRRAVGRLPNAQRPVVADAGDQRTVAAPGDGFDSRAVADQIMFYLKMVVQVVNANMFIITGGREVFAVGTEGEASQEIGVTRKRFDVFAAVGVPKFERFVFASGGDELAVGAEGRRINNSDVAGIAASLHGRSAHPKR